jgi:hypothetical protein
MDCDGNPEHEEPTGTIDYDIRTIQRNMTPARKYFSHSQSTSNNKLVLDPELKFLYVTPETKAAAEKRVKANERQRGSRKRKKEENRKGERITDGPESGDDAELAEKVKKAKQAQTIMVYIHIRVPAPQIKSRAKVPESHYQRPLLFHH